MLILTNTLFASVIYDLMCSAVPHYETSPSELRRPDNKGYRIPTFKLMIIIALHFSQVTFHGFIEGHLSTASFKALICLFAVSFLGKILRFLPAHFS